MSNDGQGGASSDGGKAKPVVPKDAASATALGAATRLGVGRHKSKVAEGAGAGSAGGVKRKSGGSSLLTALFVVVVMIGTLAIMLLFGR